MTKTNVYFILDSENYEDFGFAFSPEGTSPREIRDWNNQREWVPIVFEMEAGGFPDYLINDLNIPLCSLKLKDAIDNNVSKFNKENIIWYPVVVKSNSKIQEYYFLKIKKVLNDVIDINKSEKQNNTIFAPYFIEDKIEDIFRCDYDSSYLFVSEKLKSIIEKHKISGISFETWR